MLVYNEGQDAQQTTWQHAAYIKIASTLFFFFFSCFPPLQITTQEICLEANLVCKISVISSYYNYDHNNSNNKNMYTFAQKLL